MDVPSVPSDPGVLAMIPNAKLRKRKPTLERMRRLRRYWDMRLEGRTDSAIAELETAQGRKTTPNQIRAGLKEYLSYDRNSEEREWRFRRRRGAADSLASFGHDQVKTLMRQYDSSGRVGIPVKKVVQEIDEKGNVLKKTETIEVLSFQREVIPWLRFLLDVEKYGANLDGLLPAPEDLMRPTAIQFDLSGFFDHSYDDPIDVPHVPVPKRRSPSEDLE